MGYYTKHSLSILGCKDYDIIEQHEQNLSDKYDACFDDATKWYRCEENMIEYSKEYPDFIFLIEGKGEDGDEWKLYVKNGKSQTIYPEIIWAEFNEENLN